MRMWGVNPSKMCNQHLLGEHVEMHMFVGAMRKGTSLLGYINGGLVNTDLIEKRHAELAEEMRGRGMNHKSPLRVTSIESCGRIDVEANYVELLRRCARCREKSFLAFFQDQAILTR